jgi:hypothetical protein
MAQAACEVQADQDGGNGTGVGRVPGPGRTRFRPRHRPGAFRQQDPGRCGPPAGARPSRQEEPAGAAVHLPGAAGGRDGDSAACQHGEWLGCKSCASSGSTGTSPDDPCAGPNDACADPGSRGYPDLDPNGYANANPHGYDSGSGRYADPPAAGTVTGAGGPRLPEVRARLPLSGSGQQLR